MRVSLPLPLPFITNYIFLWEFHDDDVTVEKEPPRLSLSLPFSSRSYFMHPRVARARVYIHASARGSHGGTSPLIKRASRNSAAAPLLLREKTLLSALCFFSKEENSYSFPLFFFALSPASLFAHARVPSLSDFFSSFFFCGM